MANRVINQQVSTLAESFKMAELEIPGIMDIARDYLRMPNVPDCSPEILRLYSIYGRGVVETVSAPIRAILERAGKDSNLTRQLLRVAIGGDYSEAERREKEFREHPPFRRVKKTPIGKSVLVE